MTSPQLLTLHGRPLPPKALVVAPVHDLKVGPWLVAHLNGRVWQLTDRRIHRFACPAGAVHRRYFSAFPYRGDRSGLACVHTTQIVPMRDELEPEIRAALAED